MSLGRFIVFPCCLAILRLCLAIIQHVRPTRRRTCPTCSLAIFLGSGGHTSEALILLSALDFSRYTPRTYIMSEGDILSAEKAAALESSKAVNQGIPTQDHDNVPYKILVIPRARYVHQSILTTPPTALRSLFSCIYHVTLAPLLSSKPSTVPFADVLLLNGPGTCFVLCAAVYLNRLLCLPSPKIIYIESFARVTSLSLSGKLLRPFVDRFVVQWPELREKGEYRGWLV